MQDPIDLLTVGETARRLRRSEQTVRNLEKRGVLQGSRLSNGTRIFQRDKVEELAQQFNEKTA